MLAEMNMATGN